MLNFQNFRMNVEPLVLGLTLPQSNRESSSIPVKIRIISINSLIKYRNRQMKVRIDKVGMNLYALILLQTRFWK